MCNNCSDSIVEDIVITDSMLIVPKDIHLCGECYEEDIRIRNNRERG